MNRKITVNVAQNSTQNKELLDCENLKRFIEISSRIPKSESRTYEYLQYLSPSGLVKGELNWKGLSDTFVTTTII